MTKKLLHIPHLKTAEDLITTYEARRAGFVSLALERNKKATPYVEQARALQAATCKANSPSDLLKISNIRPALITAAGISDKALGHMEESDKTAAIKNLIKEFLEPAGGKFVEELVFRFLLTRGDTLGGSMRNFGGIEAQCKLARAIISQLALSGSKFKCLYQQGKEWVDSDANTPDIENNLRGICFLRKDGKPQTILFNIKIPLVRKNVDICLVSCGESDPIAQMLRDEKAHIALGELKGGIDPAGADEHWKTAGTSLKRIRNSYTKKALTPSLFFIGAAIEDDMANEIWLELTRGTLINAANLTVSEQLHSVVQWLMTL